jgi:hypothetical protein
MVRSPQVTAARRRSLPKSAFGLPDERKYPLDTPGRAANAKARATRSRKRPVISRPPQRPASTPRSTAGWAGAGSAVDRASHQKPTLRGCRPRPRSPA